MCCGFRISKGKNQNDHRSPDCTAAYMRPKKNKRREPSNPVQPLNKILLMYFSYVNMSSFSLLKELIERQSRALTRRPKKGAIIPCYHPISQSSITWNVSYHTHAQFNLLGEWRLNLPLGGRTHTHRGTDTHTKSTLPVPEQAHDSAWLLTQSATVPTWKDNRFWMIVAFHAALKLEIKCTVTHTFLLCILSSTWMDSSLFLFSRFSIFKSN